MSTSISEVLHRLKVSSGRNSKIQTLKLAADYTPFRRLLKFTYEPLWTYGLKAVPKPTLVGDKLIDNCLSEFNALLTSLRDRRYTGQTAKNQVLTMLNSLTAEHQDILTRVIRKDLRVGIGPGAIIAALPGLIEPFGCMLASKYEGQLGKGLYMSLKLDGLRAYYKDGNLYTRNGHTIQGVDHIVEALNPALEYDGELMVPNSHFQQASGAIRSFSMTPDAVYHVFDMPSLNAPFTDRLTELRGLVPTDHISLVKHIYVTEEEKIHRTFMKAIDQGYEGLVLKTPDHMYQQKRSKDWLKVKMTRDADLPVIGFFEGEGKYVGMLGGIIVDHEGVAVRVGSGFSDSERALIWKDQGRHLGLLAEIHYHEVTPDRSLRHPRFKGWRLDKS